MEERLNQQLENLSVGKSTSNHPGVPDTESPSGTTTSSPIPSSLSSANESDLGAVNDNGEAGTLLRKLPENRVESPVSRKLPDGRRQLDPLDFSHSFIYDIPRGLQSSEPVVSRNSERSHGRVEEKGVDDSQARTNSILETTASNVGSNEIEKAEADISAMEDQRTNDVRTNRSGVVNGDKNGRELRHAANPANVSSSVHPVEKNSEEQNRSYGSSINSSSDQSVLEHDQAMPNNLSRTSNTSRTNSTSRISNNSRISDHSRTSDHSRAVSLSKPGRESLELSASDSSFSKSVRSLSGIDEKDSGANNLSVLSSHDSVHNELSFEAQNNTDQSSNYDSSMSRAGFADKRKPSNSSELDRDASPDRGNELHSDQSTERASLQGHVFATQSDNPLAAAARSQPTRARSLESTISLTGSPIRTDDYDTSSIASPSLAHSRPQSLPGSPSVNSTQSPNQIVATSPRNSSRLTSPRSLPSASQDSLFSHQMQTSPHPVAEHQSRERTPSRPVSVLLKRGLLSFNDPDSDPNSDDDESEIKNSGVSVSPDVDHTVGDDTRFRQRVLSIAQERRISGMRSPHLDGEQPDNGGLRRGQAHYRNLETENMELRLKLQQYREMNAGDQEFTRIKVQLARAELRIDELSESLERKNAAIAQLSAERDAALHKWENELVSIQEDIELLEKSAAKYDSDAVAKASKELPEYISEKAGSSELLDAIKQLVGRTTHLDGENKQLKDDKQLLSGQNTELNDELKQLKEQVAHLTTENTRLNMETNELSSKNAQMSGQNLQLKTQNAQLSEQNADHVEKNARLTSRLEVVQANLTERESELSQQTLMVTKLETDLAKMESETRAKLRRLGEAHERELESSAAFITNKHTTEIRALRSELDSLSQALAEKSLEFQNYQAHQKRVLEQEQLAHRELTAHASRLQEIIHESKNASYLIIREFFGEVFEIMGAEYQDEVELQIEEIVRRSKQESRSKIPMLTELLVEHTRRMAMQASRQAPVDSSHRIRELEREVQDLQTIVDTVWTKAGADQVLVAQLKDLQRRLKLADEKRKSDWIEYQRVFEKHQNPAGVQIQR